VTAAAIAITATASTTTHHKKHMTSGSAATRELNQKSLEQASAGGTMAPRGAMSDSGAAAELMAAPDATPMATPAAPADTMTPPSTPQ
jgi:hypothetical protein